MKKIYLLILSIIFVSILVSCNESNTTKVYDLSKDNMPQLTDTRSEEEKIVTFKTLNGDDVTYNQNTRKIVTIMGSQDIVPFGIKLLAYEASTDITGYESYYEGASQLVGNSPFNTEEILSYHPELILVNQKMSKSNIETLKSVTKAAVIPLYTDSLDYSERLTYIGKIFGLNDSANKLIDYANNLKDSMLAEMKNLNLSGKTVTIYTYMGTGITIPPERGFFFNTILFDYLGFERLENVRNFMQDESGLAYEVISSESLRDYEGDLVIFASIGSNEISNYVTENPGWRRLKAVKNNKVGVINMDLYATKGLTQLYKQYVELKEALVKAL